MLMRSLSEAIQGFTFYILLEVSSFQESLAIRCTLCFYFSYTILRLLVITFEVVNV